MSREEAIREATRRLAEFFQPERIYLFGSVARGDANADSDLDFMVLLPDDAPEPLLRATSLDYDLGGLGTQRMSLFGERESSTDGCLCAPLFLRPSCAKAGCFMSEFSPQVEGARQWMDLATEDLGSAVHSFGGAFYRSALFHCQRCAEKAIKGFLTFHDQPFPKTHDIEALREWAEPLDPTLRAAYCPLRRSVSTPLRCVTPARFTSQTLRRRHTRSPLHEQFWKQLRLASRVSEGRRQSEWRAMLDEDEHYVYAITL